MQKAIVLGIPPKNATLYAGLTKANPRFSKDDTADHHPGWEEFIGYEGGSRLTAANEVTFEISDRGSVGGWFLTSDPKPGSSKGVLYAESLLSGNLDVRPSDTVSVTINFF